MRTRNAMIYAIVLGSWLSMAGRSHASLQQDSPSPVTAPDEAGNVRAEIRLLETIVPRVRDRGAILFLLARNYAHMGDLQKALALLKECVALDAGFVPDPNNSPSLRPLERIAEFRELLVRARRHLPAHKAHIAFTVPAEDLFPEGLAVDTSNGLFYMVSMHRKKIVKFTLTGGVADFVKEDTYDLSPIGGVHVDPMDHTVWASSDAGVKQRPELCILTRRENYWSDTGHRARCHTTLTIWFFAGSGRFLQPIQKDITCTGLTASRTRLRT